jgi:hypothetical protein
MKAYWGLELQLHSFFDLCTRSGWVVSYRPWSLYSQGKSPSYQFDRRLSGPQNRSGRGSGDKTFQSLSGLEPPIIQPVAQRYSTELSRLVSSFKFLFLLLRLSSSISFLLVYTYTFSTWSRLEHSCYFVYKIKIVLWWCMYPPKQIIVRQEVFYSHSTPKNIPSSGIF